MSYTFKVTAVMGKGGKCYTLLTSNEYPYFNLQIVETPEELRERILDDLKQQHRKVYHAQGRTDFCVIHAGGRPPGCPPLKITRDNADQIIDALCECMQAAADFWARDTKLLKYKK